MPMVLILPRCLLFSNHFFTANTKRWDYLWTVIVYVSLLQNCIDLRCVSQCVSVYPVIVAAHFWLFSFCVFLFFSFSLLAPSRCLFCCSVVRLLFPSLCFSMLMQSERTRLLSLSHQSGELISLVSIAFVPFLLLFVSLLLVRLVLFSLFLLVQIAHMPSSNSASSPCPSLRFTFLFICSGFFFFYLHFCRPSLDLDGNWSCVPSPLDFLHRLPLLFAISSRSDISPFPLHRLWLLFIPLLPTLLWLWWESVTRIGVSVSPVAILLQAPSEKWHNRSIFSHPLWLLFFLLLAVARATQSKKEQNQWEECNKPD